MRVPLPNTRGKEGQDAIKARYLTEERADGILVGITRGSHRRARAKRRQSGGGGRTGGEGGREGGREGWKDYEITGR